MNTTGNLQNMRRQRNLAVAAAIIFIAVGMAVSLPRALQRRRQLKEADAELIGLQEKIVDVQNRIREVQTRIGTVQAEIGNLSAKAH